MRSADSVPDERARPNGRDRRAFLASCAAPVLMPWRPLAHALQQKTPITWERAVDAYLDGNLPLAARVVETPPDALRAQADDTFTRWVAQASPPKAVPGVADDSADVPTTRPAGAQVRRATVRRLQGSAALAVEVMLPLSTMGGRDADLRALETIALAALDHAARFESPDLVPHDPRGRRPEDIRHTLAHFRARWHVAFLQVLVNGHRRRDVLAVAGRIKLPPGDTPALAEMRFLRGLLEEAAVRFNMPARLPSVALDSLSVPAPSPAMLSVGRRFDAASNWFR